MIEVSTAIKDLLLKHNRVILPTFGAFVTKYKEAEVNKSTNTFKPPQKELLFDTQLKNDDDTLIIDYYAKSSNRTIEESRQRVFQFIDNIKNKLADNQEIIIPHIGTFVPKEGGEIIFKPGQDNNFLLDAYGFDSFTLEPKEIEKVPQAEKQIRVETGKRKKTWILIPSLVVLVLVLIFGFVYIQSVRQNISLARSFQVNFVDLFSGNKTDTQENVFLEDTTQVGKALDDQTKVENALALQYSHTDSTDKYADCKEFIIIAGSFAQFKNAEKLRARLEQKGYSPTVVLSDNNYYRVTLMHFDDRVKALEKLYALQEENSDLKLWLLSI